MRGAFPKVLAGAARGRAGPHGLLLALLSLMTLMALACALPAHALEPIQVDPNEERIEITALGQIYAGRGDTLQVDTAPGPDGLSGRMSVRAVTAGTNPGWLVFALHNPTDKPIERSLTAERYTIIGSSVIWPDLDARRIEAVTPSLGYLPDRVRSDKADIFRITLEPGQTITYVAELSSDRPVRVQLWKPLEYELHARDRQLFNGIMLGITGLLAIFLTVVFAANHKAIFPAAALVAWCVLGYLCVDFGFWHKLLQLSAEDNAVYRAATESAIAASLLIFLGVFLRLKFWNTFVRMFFTVWIVVQLCLIAVAVIDPRLAATFARASFAAIGIVGAVLTLYLAVRGQDRALSLIPAWMLFLVWIFAAGVTLAGRLSGDIVVSGLVAGLVLIILLLGLTVTQFAFRSFEPLYGASPNDLQLRSLAIDGAGAAVWEWFARRDEVKVSPIIEESLGLTPGELSTKVDDFAKHLHAADKERFRLLLWSVQERNGGNLHIDLRMRHADNSYRWFELEAASVPHTDRKALRCVGLMRDVTEAKRAQERLMHDAVHDNLTGLPNRELFLDRLSVTVARSKEEQHVRPAVLFIDIDKFKSVNSSMGLIVGDSLLLTVARRLARHLTPQDTLARVAGDQFAILLVAAQEQRELSMLAERVRRALRSPIKIAGKEIVLTASTGIAIYDGAEENPHDLLKEAEIAMYRAKRSGADRVEVFRPELRNQPDERVTIESDLRRAIDRRQLRIMYQPIIYLPTEELAGFEALVRWEHPKLGLLNPDEFVPVAEESDLIVKLGSYVLNRSAQEAARWQKELPRGDNALFVSVNVSSRQLFRQDLIQEIRHILGRAVLPPGALRLEVTESLVMENPEQAVQMLELLSSAGAGLSMDDFGAGYSSLAYLQRFPFDTIKIDRGLVQSSTDDGPGAAIVRSIVALAHELGKKVVAEGIEQSENAGFLRALGCEYAQGFYYGEPMTDRDVMQLLRVIRKSERKLQRRGFFRTNIDRRKKRDRKVTEAPATLEAGDELMPMHADAQAASAGSMPEPAMPPRILTKADGNNKLDDGAELQSKRKASQLFTRTRMRAKAPAHEPADEPAHQDETTQRPSLEQGPGHGPELGPGRGSRSGLGSRLGPGLGKGLGQALGLPPLPGAPNTTPPSPPPAAASMAGDGADQPVRTARPPQVTRPTQPLERRAGPPPASGARSSPAGGLPAPTQPDANNGMPRSSMPERRAGLPPASNARSSPAGGLSAPTQPDANGMPRSSMPERRAGSPPASGARSLPAGGLSAPTQPDANNGMPRSSMPERRAGQPPASGARSSPAGGLPAPTQPDANGMPHSSMPSVPQGAPPPQASVSSRSGEPPGSASRPQTTNGGSMPPPPPVPPATGANPPSLTIPPRSTPSGARSPARTGQPASTVPPARIAGVLGRTGEGGPTVPPTRPATSAPTQFPSLPPAIAESLAKLAGVPITESPPPAPRQGGLARTPADSSEPPPANGKSVR